MIVTYNQIDFVYRQILESACGGRVIPVVILVANEVDAMAAAKVLTHVLRSDNIPYKLCPVANFEHITKTVEEFISMEIKSVVLINCGAIYNIPSHFNLEQGGDMKCYILDNHRPIHLANIHSKGNVIVLSEENLEDMTIDVPSSGSEIESGADTSSDDEEDDDDEAKYSSDEDDEEAEDDDNIIDDADEEQEFEEDTDEPSRQNSNGKRMRDGEQIADGSEGETGSAAENDGDAEEAEEVNTIGDGYDGEQEEDIDEDRTLIDDTLTSSDGVTVPADEMRRKKKSVVGVDETHDGVADGEERISDAATEEEEEIVVRGRRPVNEELERRRKRRRRLRNYYAVGVSYSIPTSVQLVNLVKLLNKACTSDVLWMAILGVTEQYQRSHISEELYESICQTIRSELPNDSPSTWSVADGQGGLVQVASAETGNVFADTDYRFFMYRHMSLMESMAMSPYLAVKMDLWTGAQRESKLQDLYAKLAVPLVEVKQQYKFMDPEIKSLFKRLIVSPEAQAFNLASPIATYKTFYRYNSFKNPIAAADVVHAVTALIEMYGVKADESADDRRGKQWLWQRAFNEGLDCLGTGKVAEDMLKKGIEHAVPLQRALVAEAGALLQAGGSAGTRIVRLRAFRYAYIRLQGSSGFTTVTKSGSVHHAVDGPFTRPQMLTRLAHFIMQLQVARGVWTGKNALPLVLLAEKQSTYLVVGVTPPPEASGGSSISSLNFRILFKLAAEGTNIAYRNDTFDASVLEVSSADVKDFVDNLMEVINQR